MVLYSYTIEKDLLFIDQALISWGKEQWSNQENIWRDLYSCYKLNHNSKTAKVFEYMYIFCVFSRVFFLNHVFLFPLFDFRCDRALGTLVVKEIITLTSKLFLAAVVYISRVQQTKFDNNNNIFLVFVYFVFASKLIHFCNNCLVNKGKTR